MMTEQKIIDWTFLLYIKAVETIKIKIYWAGLKDKATS